MDTVPKENQVVIPAQKIWKTLHAALSNIRTIHPLTAVSTGLHWPLKHFRYPTVLLYGAAWEFPNKFPVPYNLWHKSSLVIASEKVSSRRSEPKR